MMANTMNSLQNIVDLLLYDINQMKQGHIASDISNLGLVVHPASDRIDLLVVRGTGVDRNPICFRYEIIGMSITMAAELILGRVREIVAFYPREDAVPVMAGGADEYEAIMQAQDAIAKTSP